MTTDNTSKKAVDVSIEMIGEESSPTGLKIAYGDGTSDTLMIDECAAAIRNYATFHGLNQRIRDSGAISAKLYPTASALSTARIARVREMVEHLRTSDSWSMRSGDGSSASGNAGLFWAAAMRAWPNAQPDALRAKLEAKIASLVTSDRSEHAIKLAWLRDESTPIGKQAALIRAEREAARAAQPPAVDFSDLDGM